MPVFKYAQKVLKHIHVVRNMSGEFHVAMCDVALCVRLCLCIQVTFFCFKVLFMLLEHAQNIPLWDACHDLVCAFD